MSFASSSIESPEVVMMSLFEVSVVVLIEAHCRNSSLDFRDGGLQGERPILISAWAGVIIEGIMRWEGVLIIMMSSSNSDAESEK